MKKNIKKKKNEEKNNTSIKFGGVSGGGGCGRLVCVCVGAIIPKKIKKGLYKDQTSKNQ